MEMELQVKKDKIIVESDKYYTGAAEPANDEKLVRKALGLPVKKELVYYRDKNDASSKVTVEKFKIIEMYEITTPWFTLEIEPADGDCVRIHSFYFAEMQKPSFIEDMKKQENSSVEEQRRLNNETRIDIKTRTNGVGIFPLFMSDSSFKHQVFTFGQEQLLIMPF